MDMRPEDRHPNFGRGSGISVVNNNYGPINNGSDLDDLFSGFSDAVLSAARGG